MPNRKARRAAAFAETKRKEALEHSDSKPEQPHAQPYQAGAQHNQCDVTGSIEVRGKIETTIPADLVKKRDTADQKNEARDILRFRVEVTGLVFVIIYAGLTCWSAIEAHRAVSRAGDANKLLKETTRAQLIVSTKLRPVEAGSPVSLDIQISNIGHTVAFVGVHSGYDIRVELPSGDMPLDAGHLDTVLEPGRRMYALAQADPIPQAALDNLTASSDHEMLFAHRSRSKTLYLYGRIDYQTLGEMREIQYCYFLVRNDGKLAMPIAPPDKDEFTTDLSGNRYWLFNCPKWNTHE